MKFRDDQPVDVIDARFRVERIEGAEVHAIDIATGDAVLVYPQVHGRLGAGFVDAAFVETAARVVASISHRSIARVRAFEPRVVIDAPPPIDQQRPEMSAEDLVICALLVLDVIAHLHAAGLTEVSIEERNLRLRKVDGDWSLTLMYPPLPEMPGWGSFSRGIEAGQYALLVDVGSVFELIPRLYRTPDVVSRHLASDPWAAGRRIRLPDPALDAIINPPYSRDPKPFAGQFFAGYPRSARDFAEVLLPLAPPDRRWRDLVEAMPRVTRVTLVRDWDLIIERGEAARTEGRARLLRDREDRLGRRRKGPARGGLEPSGLPALPDIDYRLAAAYHARACVALQRGDGVKAREDLDRAVAIDRAPAYLATRGYLRATERDVSGARRDYGTAIGRGSLSGPGGYRSRSPVGGWLPLARAHYCRACLLIEEGDAHRALRDLDCALVCIDGHERHHGAPLSETSGSAIAP